MADISLLGLSEQKTKETLKNAVLTKTLVEVLHIARESYADKENSALSLTKTQVLSNY